MSKSSHIDYEGGDQTAATCTKLLSQTTIKDEDDAHYARSVSEFPAYSVSAIARALVGTHTALNMLMNSVFYVLKQSFQVVDMNSANDACSVLVFRFFFLSF